MSAHAALDLIAEARRLLSPVPAARPFLAAWPEGVPIRAVEPSRLPVLRAVPSLPALASRETRPLVDRLIDVAQRLAWRRTYGPEEFGPIFLDRYGWTELIGTRGPIASADVACGFLLLDADTHYPSHAHDAEEIYLPLAGTALWQRGPEPWTPRPPGEAIHHPSAMPHAMRTETEPMLALYAWRGGDLAEKPHIVRA